MTFLLALVPFLALFAALFVYRFHGRREILRLDSVQFFYSFILMPVFYVWMKNFLFFLLNNQFQLALTPRVWLFWDTVYSLIFLILFGFSVIQSLTKSFKLKVEKDPLYDLFEHSEYYHRWVTHSVGFGGAMLLLLFLASFNAWLDLPWQLTTNQFYGLLAFAFGTAILIFKAFLISDFGDWKFVKLMKLFVAVTFVSLIIVYAVFNPSFNSLKAMYWYQFSLFLGLSIISLIYPSRIKNKN